MQYAMLHLGAEHRRVHRHRSPLDGLDDVRAAVSIPIQVVGGLSVEQAVEAVRRGAADFVVESDGFGAALADRARALLSS
jgi:3-hexulose-6-phosphate synthase/6-phospho-3-hexuloisomerase